MVSFLPDLEHSGCRCRSDCLPTAEVALRTNPSVTRVSIHDEALQSHAFSKDDTVCGSTSRHSPSADTKAAVTVEAVVVVNRAMVGQLRSTRLDSMRLRSAGLESNSIEFNSIEFRYNRCTRANETRKITEKEEKEQRSPCLVLFCGSTRLCVRNKERAFHCGVCHSWGCTRTNPNGRFVDENDAESNSTARNHWWRNADVVSAFDVDACI